VRRAFICAASTTEALTILRQRQNALIPQEFRGANDSLIPVQVQTAEQLEAYIAEKIGGTEDSYDLVVLLCEAALEFAVRPFKYIFWTTEFDSPGSDQFGNHIAKKIARLLKSLGVLQRTMQDYVGQQTLLLPTGNFRSDSLRQLRAIIANYEAHLDFSSAVSAAVGQVIADHRKPRRLKERNQQRCFVDERDCCFKFGFEKHGQADTASPPHRVTCALSAAYRFGMRFDAERHFNVMHHHHPRLTIKFDDCHGTQQAFKEVTHVNMWPNDFCRT
jgi:hypothetical protein